MRRGLLLLAIVLLVLDSRSPRISLALCGQSLLERDINQSTLIFAGTVVRASPELVSGYPYTRYLFARPIFAKGTGPSDTVIVLALVDLAGEGQRFDVGKRYITLASNWPREPRDAFEAGMCMSGPFVIETEQGHRQPVVYAPGGRPVVAFGDRLLVLRNFHPWIPEPGDTLTRPNLARWTWKDRDTTGLHQELADSARAAAAGIRSLPIIRTEVIWRQRDPGTRVTEAEFLDQIRAIVKEQAAADASAARPPAGQTRDATPVSPGPPAQEATPPQPPVRVHPGPGGK